MTGSSLPSEASAQGGLPSEASAQEGLSTRVKRTMEKLTTYITESWDEIKNKITWSKFSELQSSAVLVLVASTIFALVIGAIDWIFKTGLQWFYTEF